MHAACNIEQKRTASAFACIIMSALHGTSIYRGFTNPWTVFTILTMGSAKTNKSCQFLSVITHKEYRYGDEIWMTPLFRIYWVLQSLLYKVYGEKVYDVGL